MVEEIVAVARAVQYEMSYLNHVSKSDVLSESSFRYPAVEWLERKGGKEKVGFEKAHPIFYKRKTDITWNDGDILNVIEMKYVKKETAGNSEQQRYFNDLLRLAHIILNNPIANVFFLTCGQTEYWKPCFQNLGVKTPAGAVPLEPYVDDNNRTKNSVEGIYSKWFSFEDSNPIRKVDTTEFPEYYKNFVSDYKFNEKNMNHPDHLVFETKLLWISEVDSMLSPCATAVWGITMNVF